MTDHNQTGENPEQTLYPYIYPWGNNIKRLTLKGRRFRVLARGKMNSCKVEFENGDVEIISRNAIRRVK